MADRQAPVRFTAQHRGRLPKIVAVGRERKPAEDVYHWFLTRSWREFFLAIALAFLAINCVFALLYLAVPGSISNAREGSFEDAFFFSVHTMGTIGYGSMAPATRYGNVIVAFEALVGMVSMALMTGITFAKFARPTAKVLFSEKMLIQPRDGVPHLVFRMANWRHNQVVEAQIHLILLLTHKTAEGESMRIPTEVKLVRDRNAMFGLTWMAMHRIDESSPFYGDDWLERLRAKQGELFLSINGYDETIMQTIHARYAYALEDIVPNARFADILTVEPDGTRVIDYTRFHEIVSLDQPSG
jgi:inward rectifier potassium channel